VRTTKKTCPGTAAGPKKRTYPKRIPRARAVAALDLAHAILDTERDSEPHGDPDAEVAIMGDIWRGWVEAATKAVGMPPAAKGT